MLLLPYLCGVLTAGATWPHVPLLVAWLSGYLLSYYALQAVKSRRPARFRPQLVLYGSVAAALGAVVVVARPQVLLYAPAYALLLGANALYARRRRDRALGNDLASVLGSSLMVFVTATVAGVPPAAVVVPFVAVLLYLVGTVMHVKTMIRERGSVAYHRASVVYHVVAFGVMAWVSLPLAFVFAVLLARAVAYPRLALAPKHVGITEIAASILLLAAVLAT
jgi:hypothetical protein